MVLATRTTPSSIDQPFYRKHHVSWLGDSSHKKLVQVDRDRERTVWPKLSYLQILRSWFAYAGCAHNVELVTARWTAEPRAEHLELHPPNAILPDGIRSTHSER
jgi:hypothetical protein